MSYHFNSTAPQHTLIRRRTLNILIADDDLEVGSLLKQILEPKGHKVTLVNDGARCISLCQQKQYDIIFIDYHMEGLTGTDVMNIVKTEKIGNNSLVFAYTGDKSSTAIDQFRISGMDGALIKPVNMKSIDSLIKNIEMRGDIDKSVIRSLQLKNRDMIIFV